MGIGIDVKGIVPNEHSGTSVKVALYNLGVRYARAICHNFGWSELLWKEPASKIGSVNTSASYSRYAALLETVARDFPDAANQFPHLLNYVEDTTFYLPVDFKLPIRLQMKEAEIFPNSPVAEKLPYYYPIHSSNATKFGDEAFTLCSSKRLLSELAYLKEFITQKAAFYGEETKLSFSNNSWGGVLDLYNTFLAGAEESMELKLPFQLRY